MSLALTPSVTFPFARSINPPTALSKTASASVMLLSSRFLRRRVRASDISLSEAIGFSFLPSARFLVPMPEYLPLHSDPY